MFLLRGVEIRMMSYDEKAVPEAQGDVAKACQEEDFFYQEELEKEGTRTSSSSSQWVVAQISRSWPGAPPGWCWW